jgi:hypothetical protein
MSLGLHHVTVMSSIPLALPHGHRIPAGSDETNKRYSAQLPMGGVRNLVDCRQRTKAAAAIRAKYYPPILRVITFALLTIRSERQRPLRGNVSPPIVVVGVSCIEIEIYTVKKEPGYSPTRFFNHCAGSSNSFLRRFPRSNNEANIVDRSR